MKALCTCAALAVATAIAHGSFADAVAQDKNKLPAFRTAISSLDKLETNGDNHCTDEINAWRKEVDKDAVNYTAHTSGTPSSDLGNFLTESTCETLKDGTFTHIYDVSGTKALVFSANRAEAIRAKMTCSEAVAEWKKAFKTFGGKYPAEFQQGGEQYTDPNAVGLVSLFADTAQPVYCGNPKGCDEGIVLCYIKPSFFLEGKHPVGAKMWHKVEESFKLKPTLEAHENDQEYVDAVNAVRDAEGLKLEKFTGPLEKKRLRLTKTKSVSTPYQDALYNVTCEQIEASSLDPKVEDTYTLIYAVSDDATPPTAKEAVEFWKTGYSELGPDVPPAFTARKPTRDEGNEDGIYYNSAVAGFVSLMVDGAREMRCYNATGCSKGALICFLADPTLVEGAKPISDTTWQKILTLDSNDNFEKTMKFVKLNETENCLTEINEFRTQESLGLNAFVAKGSSSTDSEVTTRNSEELEMFTCDALKAGNAPFLSTLTKRSVMYYSGSSTCSDAVTEWKKGYDKFKDLTIPPKYTSSEAMYQTGAATNFISLVSEGKETAATCYSVEGCTEPGLVCVLEPAVFEDGKSPITETTWQKVTTTFSNGASSSSVYGALLSSVLVVVGLFALNF